MEEKVAQQMENFDLKTAPEHSSLSIRGTELSSAGAQLAKWRSILEDAYDPESNPNGFVNMGTAENYIMLQDIADFSNKHLSLQRVDLSYGRGPWGGPRLRRALARHMNRHFHPLVPFEPSNFVIANGVTSLCEMLGFTLFEAGDAVLLSRPIYQAFKGDFGTKAKYALILKKLDFSPGSARLMKGRVECEFVSFGDRDQFGVDGVGQYESAIVEAAKRGRRIRAILLCHPHNPLGRCYTREALIAYMQLCEKHKIHLIMDEIYALSVYEVPDPQATEFESISTFETGRYISPEYLHLIYGMSKDTAAGGIRLGCLYTLNAALQKAMAAANVFHWSGNISEKLATALLEDEEWMDGFLKRSRHALARRNVLTRKLLDEAGIEYYRGANAGFFLWVDLRPFLPNSILTEGEEDWTREEALTDMLLDNKLFITTGQTLSAEEPGWYRIIFAQDESIIREGFRRLRKAIKLE